MKKAALLAMAVLCLLAVGVVVFMSSTVTYPKPAAVGIQMDGGSPGTELTAQDARLEVVDNGSRLVLHLELSPEDDPLFDELVRANLGGMMRVHFDAETSMEAAVHAGLCDDFAVPMDSVREGTRILRLFRQRVSRWELRRVQRSE